jgi:hypothetical protein
MGFKFYTIYCIFLWHIVSFLGRELKMFHFDDQARRVPVRKLNGVNFPALEYQTKRARFPLCRPAQFSLPFFSRPALRKIELEK